MNQAIPSMTALPVSAAREASMGRILVELGKITHGEAERVVRLQKELGIRFGEAAQRLGLITEADIQMVLARQFGYPYLQAGQGDYPPELVAAHDPFSAQVETLRAVRSQLMQRWFVRGRKALAIASVNPGEGVSFFAANLAVVFSQLGEQTLLIDANLRNPRQHRIFNLHDGQGLSDLLVGRTGLHTLAKVDSFADLSVLPAGTLPPNPHELVCRAEFGDLRASLASRFGAILIDVPAFSTGADALAIAAGVGGVLLVARRHRTRLAAIEAVQEQLSRNGTEIVGSVLVDF